MNKKYLIVGGSSGIGYELAKNLTSVGNHLIVLSRNQGNLHLLPNTTHIPYDVVSEDAFPKLKIDSVDGFVYCPGSIKLKPFYQLKVSDFQTDFDLNVKGAIKVLQSVLAPLQNSSNPSIVFFSTIAVSQGMPLHASVATSKGAIEGMTRSLAAELSPKIRVNCIAPSITETPLSSRILSSEDKKISLGKKHPLKRIGTAKEVATLAAYLLSDDAKWMTGQIIGLDGGMSSIKPI